MRRGVFYALFPIRTGIAGREGKLLFTRKAERRLRYSFLPALSSRSLWRRLSPSLPFKKSDELFYLYVTYPCREQNLCKILQIS